MKKILLISLFASLVLVTACSESNANGENDQDYQKFAQCMTEKGAKMYGTFACSACNYQKQMFGDAASELNYIECSPQGENSQAEFCIEKNIQAYPTWEFEDGSRLVGAQPLETLAEKVGCGVLVSSQ